VLVTHYNNNY